MGAAFETINAYSAAVTTVTTVSYTADPTQSLQIRSCPNDPCAWMYAVWANTTAATDSTIHSARMHDPNAAVKVRSQTTLSTPLQMEAFKQPMFSQDTPTIQSTFASAPDAVQGLGYCLYYPNLPGVAANLDSWQNVWTRAMPWFNANGGYLGVKVNPVTSSGTTGALGAGVALNSTDSNMKANSWYALLGYECSVVATNISLAGVDTGNLQNGGPGALSPIETRRWWWFIDQTLGVPSIPIINSANAGGTLVYASDKAGGTTIPVELLFLYLGPSTQNTSP